MSKSLKCSRTKGPACNKDHLTAHKMSLVSFTVTIGAPCSSILINHLILDFCVQFCRFYQTLLFWLDEPRLHDPNLYLPALPPEYEAERLLTLFHQQQVWATFIYQLIILPILSTINENHVTKCFISRCLG